MSEPTRPPGQWLKTARSALTVIRGYSFIGVLMAMAVGALSFFFYKDEMAQWICRLGAMGCLLGAAAGLNVMDRLVHGRRFPITLVSIGLTFIAVAFLGVGMGAVRYELGAGWSPLVAACYIFVLARILWRFRGPAPTS